ncbi:iron-containing alcohol dehydrogenase, partial [bacterium]|nr:iron-containing alcohol dehydrogenase [bacterium]
ISDKNTPVLVFSDGVVKASGISESSIDMLVLQQLRELSVPFEHVIVAQVLNCSPESVHASVEAVSALKQFLGSRTAVPVLVIGSGSITDIVKHTLHELAWHSVPFVVMPTALTVTAFTSHFAVLEDSGAKRTRLSRRVNTCVWFTPVLASAPIDMTRAGYGDLLARFVAYGDWYLGWRLGVADRYDELAFHLMEPFGWHLRAHASALAAWPLRADTMEDLSAILSMAGIAMSVSGETTPLSGYEHTISHALDYLRLISHRPLAWHGQQVALASLASAESYDHLLQFESLNLHSVQPLSSAHIQRTIRQLLQNAPYFGPGEFSLTHEERLAGLVPLQESIARACELFSADYLKKHALWEKAFAKISDFEQQWPEIRAHLKTLVIPASDMRELIEKSGLALVPEELSQPTSALEYRWAVRFAPFVRSRMSLADLIFWIGEDPALWATI